MKFRLLLFILLTDLMLPLHLNAQSTKQYVQYLKNNSIDIKVTGADWDKVADSSIYRSEIFWVGEAHAIQYSYDAVWILFRYLHAKTGFKYYLLESGYFSELYLNKYFDTGDENYLKMVFNATKGTMGCNKDAYEFYRKLYSYNQELDKENRIEFLSIDIEHQYVETDQYIRSLFDNRDLPKDSCDFINIFLSKQGEYKNLYHKLADDMKAHPDKYQTILQNECFTTWYLVRNINYLFRAHNSANFDKTRDSLMLENFKIRLLTHDFKKSKAFAYFGTSHCYLDKTKQVDWIASLIKKYSPALKSTSIMMLYSNCKRMIPAWLLRKTGHLRISKNKDFVNVTWESDSKNILRKSSGEGYTLFNIAKKGSIFTSSKKFVDNIADAQFTTDYYQYILLIKDSPASIPYGN
ncbi:MAG: hypothetical protein NTY96_10580 [Bacteroidetes bacterium]|nr:hypothetical protein [Bacteroidota bacterium]